MVVFAHLPVDSSLYHAVRVLPRRLERGISPEHRTHRCLRLPEDSEVLYKILSPKHRQNYRRKARKLLQDFSGGVRFERHKQASDLIMFREVESIAERTYQRGLGFGSQDIPEIPKRWELAACKTWAAGVDPRSLVPSTGVGAICWQSNVSADNLPLYKREFIW